MTTNIQVRGVDEKLALAARARADATHRSLSAYVRELIERDLAGSDSRLAMRRLLREIADDPRPRVARDATPAALADVRREMGTG
ncbi:MAG: FitA-like ribbon-helix-helix domain-containing protein [Jiangellaceae bacterium]